MTNPRCMTCHGWGFVPGAVPMQICDAPYKGRVCTPRTAFARFDRPKTTAYGMHDSRPVQMPGDKRREAREAK